MSAAPLGPPTPRARRGDLAVLVSTRRDFVLGQGVTEATQVDLTVVASVTRGGVVKAVRSAWRGSAIVPLERWSPANPQINLVSQERIDVDGAMEAARNHTWPGHPDQPMPFDSLDEARTALLPFLRRRFP